MTVRSGNQFAVSRQPGRNHRPGILFLVALLGTFGGCLSTWRRGGEDEEANAKLAKLLNVPDPPDLIREAAVAKGMQAIRVDGYAVVDGLAGSGGAPEPSVMRDEILQEMRRDDIPNPNHFLDRNETALVEVRAIVPAGAREGDPIDLLVISPPESHAKDLHGGWMIGTQLRHQQLLNRRMRKSGVLAMGKGPVLTLGDCRPESDGSERLRGMVLAGGRVTETRDLGLVLRPEFQHVQISAAIANAINRRFFFFDGTTRRGIATAKEDDYIQLEVHPRYAKNQGRLLEVVRAIGVKPESAETQTRLAELGKRLGDPETASDAAIQLEGLGESAIPTLLKGLETSDLEVRFYVAEALAYLDREEAIEPLIQAARDTAAFRYPALLALQGIEQHQAIESLRELMNQESMETRYGAFCAVRRRPDAAGALAGENVDGQFRLFTVPSEGTPAVVVSMRESPEIVVFGDVEPLDMKVPLFGSGGLMVRTNEESPGFVHISRFRPGKEDQFTSVPATVPGLCRGIASVGGGYGDVVSILREAKANDCFTQRLAMDPLTAPLRTYHRDQKVDDELSQW
ncbi:MAG: flagellar basal body P-ring protein FlgI [Planctomycetota bacterium]